MEYDDKKLYPIVVHYSDGGQMRAVCFLLKLLESSVSTGEAIYSLIDDFTQNCINWDMCLSFGAYNAAVMRGLGKGMASFLSARHPHVYLLGRLCHFFHLAAKQNCSSAHCECRGYAREHFLLPGQEQHKRGTVEGGPGYVPDRCEEDSETGIDTLIVSGTVCAQDD